MSGAATLILGLGESGLAMARWVARSGVPLRVWDSRAEPPNLDALRSEIPAAEFVGGEAAPALLDGVGRVLKSPGLAPTDPRIAPLLAAARADGMPVQGELDLFVKALSGLRAERGYAPKLLAVTGTNGKTTTTSLTALLVERAGRSVAAAGNIGPTMLDTLAGMLARPDGLPDVWVLELSSFQLDGVEGFDPDAATVLNVSQDHLDWHGTMAAYAAAKARIFGPGTTMVVNRDDPLVEAMVPAPAAPPKGSKAKSARERTVVRFGLDAPRRAGDYGLVVENGMAWLVRAIADDDAAASKRRRDVPAEFHMQRLMPADALRIRGRHNAANALAALALAGAIGCPLSALLHGLREYGGEPHRVQWVGNVGDVEAYDDSKGTNVGATVAALDGLGADKAPAKLVVILGGDGKGQDFAPLAAPLARHARAVATIGRDAGAIEAAVAGIDVPLLRHETLDAAVGWCFEQARAGDAVLLSPACASLDMFRNYAHRAEVFVQAVQSLANDRGQA